MTMADKMKNGLYVGCLKGGTITIFKMQNYQKCPNNMTASKWSVLYYKYIRKSIVVCYL